VPVILAQVSPPPEPPPEEGWVGLRITTDVEPPQAGKIVRQDTATYTTSGGVSYLRNSYRISKLSFLTIEFNESNEFDFVENVGPVYSESSSNGDISIELSAYTSPFLHFEETFSLPTESEETYTFYLLVNHTS